jgi:trimeric autotransporter adhesin
VAYKATVDFGGFVVGVTTPTDSTFTIENLGTTTLTLTGTPVDLWGADMADFTIVHPSVNSVAAAGTTTFTIAFNPSTVGVKNAAITIGSNDKDEASYVFYLTGTGNAPEPEINVQAGTTSVASGATVDFGSLVSGTSKDSTFTIENLGTLDLTLSGTPAVSISGDVTEFTIVQTGVTSPVSISGTTSFTVTYNPTSAGIKNATITIANDDIDESSYTINLTGTATFTAEPEINVK